MIVILAEKNSAAQNFAAALGGMSGTYKGEKYQIVHAVGHLYGFPKDVSSLVDESLAEKYKTWDMANLPWDPADIKWVIKPDPSKKDVIQHIREAFSHAGEVCIATDNDSSGEGDLLAWEILTALRWRGNTTRMLFSDESVNEVRKAFENRSPVASAAASGAFVKANARTKFDYLSMQLTRIASLQAKERGHRMLVRQGRLKSVMVYLIGWQLEQIKNYKKIPFFEARYRDENGHVYKRPEADDIRFPSPDKIDLSEFEDSKVIVDSKEVKRSAPGPLLDLAGMTSILVEKKGFNSKKLMDVYQKMYQAHIVSYPRTDDKKITEEQFEQLKADRFKIAEVVGIDSSLLTFETLRKKHYQKSAAHGANRPGTNVPESLDALREEYGEEGVAIYVLLAENSLALFGEDYVYEQQLGHIEKHPEFVGKANIPVDYGYKKVFNDDLDEDKEEKNDLPLGEEASSFIHEGSNPKPRKPTMKWLIGAGGQLEKYNVGTGATRTSTFNEIVDGKDPKKQLVKMNKKGALAMTAVGDVSYILLRGCYISSPKVTEKLLAQMESVGEFKQSPDVIINSITPLVEHDMAKMIENAASIPQGNDSFKPKEKTEPREHIPSGEVVSFSKEWGGHVFTDEEIDALYRGEEISFKAVSKAGNDYDAVGSLQKQKIKKGPDFWGFALKEREVPESWCGHTFTENELSDLLAGIPVQGTFVSPNTGKEFSCKVKWEKGRIAPVFDLPDQWCKHVFTDEEKKKLLSGKKIFADDFVSSKTGNTFSCNLRWKNGSLKAEFPKNGGGKK